MEIYTGYIPKWLQDEDRKRLTAKRRRRIIAESDAEGQHGISGRDSIKIFNDFFSTYAKEDKRINMSDLCKFFAKVHGDVRDLIPQGFLDSLLRMYDYTVLQEVKESLYCYNETDCTETRITFCHQHKSNVVACTYTRRNGYHGGVHGRDENRLLLRRLGPACRFRKDAQRNTPPTRSPKNHGRGVVLKPVFPDLRDRYVHNLKKGA
jgi:hypothetical protein